MSQFVFSAIAGAAVLAIIPAYAQDKGDWLSKERFQIRAVALP